MGCNMEIARCSEHSPVLTCFSSPFGVAISLSMAFLVRRQNNLMILRSVDAVTVKRKSWQNMFFNELLWIVMKVRNVHITFGKQHANQHKVGTTTDTETKGHTDLHQNIRHDKGDFGTPCAVQIQAARKVRPALHVREESEVPVAPRPRPPKGSCSGMSLRFPQVVVEHQLLLRLLRLQKFDATARSTTSTVATVY